MTTTPLTPWRRTVRTIFQALVGLAVMLPVLVSQTGLDPAQIPWLAGVLAIAALITRLMALPVVEAFLQRFLPWLAARDQRGAIAHSMALAFVALFVAAAFAIFTLSLIGVLR